jgi:hypothetical protein
MEKASVLTGNELIAEFMDIKLNNEYDDAIDFVEEHVWEFNDEWYDCSRPEDLGFDVSWDWLMPVVEKIESLGHNCTMGFNNYCGFKHRTLKNSKGNVLTFESCHIVTEPDKIYTWTDYTKIEGVYIAVIKFIEWYNGNNKSN